MRVWLNRGLMPRFQAPLPSLGPSKQMSEEPYYEKVLVRRALGDLVVSIKNRSAARRLEARGKIERVGTSGGFPGPRLLTRRAPVSSASVQDGTPAARNEGGLSYNTLGIPIGRGNIKPSIDPGDEIRSQRHVGHARASCRRSTLGRVQICSASGFGMSLLVNGMNHPQY